MVESSDPLASAGVDTAELKLGRLDGIVGYQLRRAQLAVFDDFRRRFATLDLTPTQYSTLSLIAENPGRRQSDIAAALGVARPNFVALMDELESRGLVERERSDVDRRAYALKLTAAGAALLERALRVQAEQEAEICNRIGETVRRRLIDTLMILGRL